VKNILVSACRIKRCKSGFSKADAATARAEARNATGGGGNPGTGATAQIVQHFFCIQRSQRGAKDSARQKGTEKTLDRKARAGQRRREKDPRPIAEEGR